MKNTEVVLGIADAVICPYCGHAHYSYDGYEGIQTMVCEECGQQFKLLH